MNRITLDATLLSKLASLAEPAQLCDETGRVVGQFIPAAGLSEYEPWEPPISEEELQERERSNEWYTTEQVLAHLKSLEQP